MEVIDCRTRANWAVLQNAHSAWIAILTVTALTIFVCANKNAKLIVVIGALKSVIIACESAMSGARVNCFAWCY